MSCLSHQCGYCGDCLQRQRNQPDWKRMYDQLAERVAKIEAFTPSQPLKVNYVSTDRNRQTGRTTSQIAYAERHARGWYIVHNCETAKRYSPRTTLVVVTARPNMIETWEEQGKPPITVDHVVWEFTSAEQLQGVVDLLKKAAEQPGDPK